MSTTLWCFSECNIFLAWFRPSRSAQHGGVFLTPTYSVPASEPTDVHKYVGFFSLLHFPGLVQILPISTTLWCFSHSHHRWCFSPTFYLPTSDPPMRTTPWCYSHWYIFRPCSNPPDVQHPVGFSHSYIFPAWIRHTWCTPACGTFLTCIFSLPD